MSDTNGDHDHAEIWRAIEALTSSVEAIAALQQRATVQILAIADVTATNTTAIAELRGDRA